MIDYLPAVNKSGTLDADKLEDELKRIASGDKSALAELYGDTYTPIYSYILSFLKNTYDTEDVLHDLYVSVFVNAKSYKPGGKPLAWIFAIARNMSLKKLSERKRKADFEDKDWEKLLVGEGLSLEESSAIKICLTQLSREEREIVVMHTLAGFMHKEIAKIMSLPLGTVLSKYNRAIKKLRIIYEGRIEDENSRRKLGFRL